MIRILVVDDHPLIRLGLRRCLEVDAELEVVGEAEDGCQALLRIEELLPQVVLMDLLMPGMGGLDTIALCRERFPSVEIVVLTSVLDDRQVVRALELGVRSYLLKGGEIADLRRTVKAAAEGRTEFSAEVSRCLIRSLRAPEPIPELTEREQQVLQALSRGDSNKEISDALAISEKTTKTHVSALLTKLGLRRRTQAVAYAWRNGLTDPPAPLS